MEARTMPGASRLVAAVPLDEVLAAAPAVDVADDGLLAVLVEVVAGAVVVVAGAGAVPLDGELAAVPAVDVVDDGLPAVLVEVVAGAVVPLDGVLAAVPAVVVADDGLLAVLVEDVAGAVPLTARAFSRAAVLLVVVLSLPVMAVVVDVVPAPVAPVVVVDCVVVPVLLLGATIVVVFAIDETVESSVLIVNVPRRSRSDEVEFRAKNLRRSRTESLKLTTFTFY